jgi:hypothetical protein
VWLQFVVEATAALSLFRRVPAGSTWPSSVNLEFGETTLMRNMIVADLDAGQMA